MSVYVDNIGNFFLGDCLYANHNINYPTINYLESTNVTDLSANLTSMLSNSALRYRNIASQSLINSTNYILVAFSTHDDIIDDRFVLPTYRTNNFDSFVMYNDNGYTSTTNSFSVTNKLVSGGYNKSSNTITNGSYHSFPQWYNQADSRTHVVQTAGVCDNSSLGLFYYQRQFQVISTDYADSQQWCFTYAGKLDAVNTNFDYYSNNITNSSILFVTIGNDLFRSGFVNTGGGLHYISNSSKTLLTTGDAQYPIVCSDGQSPTAQWATDFYVFDNNATLGYPAIGKVRNLLLGTGTYTIGNPVKLIGSVKPDGGSDTYLPVGTFAGKTVLMRCYSSPISTGVVAV